jgi:hypothetical protein
VSTRLALGAIGALAGLVALWSRGSLRGDRNTKGKVQWSTSPGVIWMHPLDFLAFTSTPSSSRAIDQGKVDEYEAAMKEGATFPALSLEGEAEDGRVFVVMHNGRHRALAAHHLGERLVPVEVFIEDLDTFKPVPVDSLLEGSGSERFFAAVTQPYDEDEIDEYGYAESRDLRVKVAP